MKDEEAQRTSSWTWAKWPTQTRHPERSGAEIQDHLNSAIIDEITNLRSHAFVDIIVRNDW